MYQISRPHRSQTRRFTGLKKKNSKCTSLNVDSLLSVQGEQKAGILRCPLLSRLCAANSQQIPRCMQIAPHSRESMWVCMLATP